MCLLVGHSLESASPHGPWGHSSLPRATAHIPTDRGDRHGDHEKKSPWLQAPVTQPSRCKPRAAELCLQLAWGLGGRSPESCRRAHGHPRCASGSPPSKARRRRAHPGAARKPPWHRLRQERGLWHCFPGACKHRGLVSPLPSCLCPCPSSLRPFQAVINMHRARS